MAAPFSPINMQKYEMLDIVGKGAYGSVYKARSKQDHRTYVVKRVALKDAEATRELEILQRIRHPFIVAYKDTFEYDEHLCIVMTFCSGGDLYHHIKATADKNEHFDEDLVLTWFSQLLLALHYLHDKKKILHRDLKTQNIFLKRDKKTVMLGDFGIAKELTNSLEMAITVIGTPYYMSPELLQGIPYNGKSDVWALGCVLYEICTLQHAFDAKNLSQLVMKIMEGKYPPIPRQYSSELGKVIDYMLMREPSHRPSIKQLMAIPFLRRRIDIVEGPLRKSQKHPSAASASHSSQLRPKTSSRGDRGKSSHPATDVGPSDDVEVHRPATCPPGNRVDSTSSDAPPPRRNFLQWIKNKRESEEVVGGGGAEQESPMASLVKQQPDCISSSAQPAPQVSKWSEEIPPPPTLKAPLGRSVTAPAARETKDLEVEEEDDLISAAVNLSAGPPSLQRAESSAPEYEADFENIDDVNTEEMVVVGAKWDELLHQEEIGPAPPSHNPEDEYEDDFEQFVEDSALVEGGSARGGGESESEGETGCDEGVYTKTDSGPSPSETIRRLCIDQLGGERVYERALRRIQELPRNTETEILEGEVAEIAGRDVNKQVIHLMLWVALAADPASSSSQK